MPHTSPDLEPLLARITPASMRTLTLRLLASSPKTRSVAVTALIAELRAGADLGTGAVAAAAHETLREAIRQAIMQVPELCYVSASA